MSANYCQGRKKSLGYFLNKNWEINCMLYIHIFTLCIGKYSYPVNIYKLRGGRRSVFLLIKINWITSIDLNTISI